MEHPTGRSRRADNTSDRDRVIAYLKYAVDDVAEISPSSASLLVAVIDDLQHAKAGQAVGNDLRKPS
jgi:hypothetical protein